MDIGRLVTMANQIARNLAQEHDPAAATAEHIRLFWDPRMKAAIAAHGAADGEGLDAVVRAALAQV